jgi:hypothetical protein
MLCSSWWFKGARIEMSKLFAAVCVSAALLCVSTAAESPKAILDMDPDDVRSLLARIGAIASRTRTDLAYDGADLVDFIRWYDSAPPIARYIAANNENPCKAWDSVAHYFGNKQQMASSSPHAFLEW